MSIVQNEDTVKPILESCNAQGQREGHGGALEKKLMRFQEADSSPV